MIEDDDTETFTIAEAVKRHKGLDRDYFMRRCKKGRKLLEKYGERTEVPAKEVARAIFAKKYGKYWHIPRQELDRLFL